VLLGISNLLKPLRLGGEQTGFVFLGQRLEGLANTVAGPLFGVFLLVYAAAILGQRRVALTLGYVYGSYVLANLILFPLRTTIPSGAGYAVFGLVYSAVALGVSWGVVYLLRQHRDALR
jgi:hypothetical protein